MRVKRGVKARRSKKRILKASKGFVGARHRLIRSAYTTLERALRYGWRDRRAKKRDFRQLWVTRIGIAARDLGTSYSKLMGGLNKKNIRLNRKVLSELAVSDPKAFQELVTLALK